MSTMIFKHFDGNSEFILAHPTTRLLYSVQLPKTIYVKMTKKTNKNKRQSDFDVSTICPDVREQIIHMLTNNQEYEATFNQKYEDTFHEDSFNSCQENITIGIEIDYKNNQIYSEKNYYVKLRGTLIEDYLTIPTEIFENLTPFELYAHSSKMNKILKTQIEILRERFEYI